MSAVESMDLRELPESSELPEMADVSDRSERQMLGNLEARLIARFGPSVGPDEVRRCVAQIAVGYEDAKVRTYLAILIERAATERLQARVRQGPCNTQSVDQGGAP